MTDFSNCETTLTHCDICNNACSINSMETDLYPNCLCTNCHTTVQGMAGENNNVVLRFLEGNVI